MKDVEEFLLKNGFYKKLNCYANSKCTVGIHSEENCDFYSVESEEGVMYSNDIQIYWLIGVLTYYGYMDKNYNQ